METLKTAKKKINQVVFSYPHMGKASDSLRNDTGSAPRLLLTTLTILNKTRLTIMYLYETFHV